MEEKFRSNAVQKSPSVEGVDFFAIAKKDQVSVGKQISNIPLLVEVVPAIAGGVVLATHGRIF